MGSADTDATAEKREKEKDIGYENGDQDADQIQRRAPNTLIVLIMKNRSCWKVVHP